MSDPAEEPPPPAVTFLSSVRPALVCSLWPSQGTADPRPLAVLAEHVTGCKQQQMQRSRGAALVTGSVQEQIEE